MKRESLTYITVFIKSLKNTFIQPRFNNQNLNRINVRMAAIIPSFRLVKGLMLVTIVANLTFSSCKKETIFVYGVEDVDVRRSGGNKQNLKNEIEFISIAYNDIFGSSPNQTILSRLSVIYLAFGDKKLLEDLIIKNMLNNPSAQIPTDAQMRADVEQFVREVYLRLYNRAPDEFELWKLKDFINSDPNLTVQQVYYAMMTADEYRYY